jgi:hypothetical protein
MTPWAHMQRGKGVGVDCAQILAKVFEAVVPEQVSVAEMDRLLRLHFPPDGYYPPDFMLHSGEEKYLAIIEHFARKIDRPAHDGDIALFKRGRCISHSGIVDRWPRVTHVAFPTRAHVFTGAVGYDDADNGPLGSCFVGIWTLNAWT